MKIVPAVLSNNLEDYTKAYSQFEAMHGNEKVHIDIMDGIFVKTISPDFESILKIETDLARQVHLMVQEPIPYIELCMKYYVNEVIVHLGTNYIDMSFINKLPMDVFIGINPENKFTDFENILNEAKGFLFMTVHPGLQGQAFLPKELEKVQSARDVGYTGRIIVDGSVNIETINQVKKFKVDEAIIGSGIIKQKEPIKAYNDLQNELKN